MTNFRSCQWGSSPRGLCMRDPPLSPQSTWVEMFSAHILRSVLSLRLLITRNPNFGKKLWLWKRIPLGISRLILCPWLLLTWSGQPVALTVIQAKMLSGRYVTDKLSRHWTQNKAGICSIPTCTGQDIGSLEDLLLFCTALSDARERMVALWQAVAGHLYSFS